LLNDCLSFFHPVDQLQNDGDIEQTTPTIGFNVEVLQYKNIKFQVWDLGGQTTIRPYWRCYYPNTDAIIFVVDSCDTDRLGIAKQELMAMLEEEELKDTILLVRAHPYVHRCMLANMIHSSYFYSQHLTSKSNLSYPSFQSSMSILFCTGVR
jgi:hypothetical protein